jgi:2-amino-4-hydroxy-6-hydroxymethyldihydropteridine diphosphokinase / dihydropteroate synthase
MNQEQWTQRRGVHQVAIAFGSNMGHKIGYIERALFEMQNAGLKVSKTSPIYETKPMYYEAQDTFLNGVCQVQTEKEPIALLDALQAIESKLDRRREIAKGPRTIDLDVILYDDQTIQHERLEVPHKLLHEREFVLRPLNDIMPDAVVRSIDQDKTVAELYQNLRHGDESMSPVVELTKHLPLIRPRNPSRKTLIMAILNLTPDSFSDGGLHTPHDEASIQRQARAFFAAGADIIDIGGQSTRPRADLLSPTAEAQRILPAIRAIRSTPDLGNVAISIDTFYSDVARQAIAAGADIINDVSAGLLDENMLSTVAELGKTIVLMHMRGNPHTMSKLTEYPRGVIDGVAMELSERVEAAEKAGIPRWRIVLDPGIGFAKNQVQNLELLRSMSRLREADVYPKLQGIPWLVGTSRKGFIGKITGVQQADQRLMGTAAAVTASVAGGADIVRVHDVKEMAEVVKMADAIYRSPGEV